MALNGFETVPDDLHAGAGKMRQAAALDGKANQTANGALIPDQTLFGVSGQAAQLAGEWQQTVEARQTELTALQQETDQLADSLDSNANDYHSVETRISDHFAGLTTGLGRPSAERRA